MTFRYWNTSINGWAVEGGNYEILVGSSSADIRLRGNLDVTEQGRRARMMSPLCRHISAEKITKCRTASMKNFSRPYSGRVLDARTYSQRRDLPAEIFEELALQKSVWRS